MIKKILSVLNEILGRYKYTPIELIRQRGGVVGNNIFIGQDVYIDLDYAFLFSIGDGAVISARTIIEMHDSSIANVKGVGKLKVGRVHICERAYIGANSVVLPGVRIGRGSIVGALSLVNKDVPDHEVWAGAPARFICTVDELISKRELEANDDNVAFFDWIGEPEKHGVDYVKVKEKLLFDVARYFESYGPAKEQQ